MICNSLGELFQDEPGIFLAMVTSVGALIVFGILIITVGAVRVVHLRAKEQSRREIAAYVAEGSITAEDGDRLLNGAPKPAEQACSWWS